MAKGMILAAGQGTRVRPLTNVLPKAMVPILGKPVMEYLIEHLAKYGVTEIMVNVAFHNDRIEQYFGDGHRWGVQIGYSYEGGRAHGDIVPKPRGSAGGIRKIQDFSGFFDETTIVLCGDALIDLDIGAALQPGENNIQVEVLAPLRNHFAGRGLNGDPRYAHMKVYANQLVAAGLVGPVSVAELGQ